MDEQRTRPEQFLALIRQQQRGRLKVYLGFAPGVGKTYEMLQEGHFGPALIPVRDRRQLGIGRQRLGAHLEHQRLGGRHLSRAGS